MTLRNPFKILRRFVQAYRSLSMRGWYECAHCGSPWFKVGENASGRRLLRCKSCRSIVSLK